MRFESLEDEVQFLRAVVRVTRVTDEILEDCLEHQLGVAAALDVFLAQAVRRNVLLGIAIAQGTTADGRGISYFTSITRYTAWLSEIIRQFESRPRAGSSSLSVP